MAHAHSTDAARKCHCYRHLLDLPLRSLQILTAAALRVWKHATEKDKRLTASAAHAVCGRDPTTRDWVLWHELQTRCRYMALLRNRQPTATTNCLTSVLAAFISSLMQRRKDLEEDQEEGQATDSNSSGHCKSRQS